MVSRSGTRTRLPVGPGASVSETLISNDIRISLPCGGVGACGLCRIRITQGTHPPSAGETRLLTAAEIEAGIRLACLTRPRGPLSVEIEPPAPSPSWQALDESSHSIQRAGTAAPGATEDRSDAVGEAADETPGGQTVLCVDLGTTQIRLSLCSVRDPHRVSGAVGFNPQVFAGADVLSRLSHAVSSERASRELAWTARGAIGEGLAFLEDETTARPADIRAVTVVGNTAMLCLLCEDGAERLLDPSSWARPFSVKPSSTRAWTAAWGLEHAEVQTVPPCAGFIGSDLLAALVATRLLEGPAPALLIDFGTNSEIALWDGHALHVTSAAGGPAFEGTGISCGMPAVTGAIYRAEWNGEIVCETLGGVASRGVCGSGLVDIIALLRDRGILNQTGRFKVPLTNGRFPLGPPDMGLTTTDIDLVQRAKAAIGAGIVTLVGEARLASRDSPEGVAGAPDTAGIRRLCICGSFGRYLNPERARAVGLLPDCPGATIEMVENAALAGCEMLALDAEARRAADNIRAGAIAIDLSSHPRFDTLFFECLALRPLPPLRERNG